MDNNQTRMRTAGSSSRIKFIVYALTMLVAAVFVLAATGCKNESAPVIRSGDFELLYPLNGEKGVSTSPVLRWEDVEGADYYEVILSTDELFENSITQRVEQTLFVPNQWLGYEQSYFWKVDAIVGQTRIQSASDVYAFTTGKQLDLASLQADVDQHLIVIDDFEQYSAQLEVRQVYEVHLDGDQVELDLTESGGVNASKALVFKYDISSKNWAGIQMKPKRTNWSEMQAIKFWMKPDGSGNTLILQVADASGSHHSAEIPISGVTAGWHQILLDDFEHLAWSGGNAVFERRSVVQFQIYVTGAGAGEILLDHFEVGQWDDTLGDTKHIEQGSRTIDDFEVYNSDDELSKVYHGHPGGDTVAVQIERTHKLDGRQSMRIDYELGNKGWGGITNRSIFGMSGATGIVLWINPDGSGHEFVVQLTEASGESWEMAIPLDDKIDRIVEIPFSMFKRADWSKGDGILDLNDIIELSFYVRGGGKGTIYVDELRIDMVDHYKGPSVRTAVHDHVPEVVPFGPATHVIDDFEAYGHVRELNAAYQLHPEGDPLHLGLSTSEKYEGKAALAIDYELSNKFWGGVTRVVKLNWHGTKGIEFWFKGDGSGNEMTFQFGDSTDQLWEASVKMDSKDPVWVQLPFTSFRRPEWNSGDNVLRPGDITQFGFYVKGGGAGTIYIDALSASDLMVKPQLEESKTEAKEQSPDTQPDGSLSGQQGQWRESFESYTAQSIKDRFQTHMDGDPVIPQIAMTDKPVGRQALKLDYKLTNQYWGGVMTILPNVDWSGGTGVDLWVSPDGSGNELVVQFAQQNGENWASVIKLDGNKGKEHHLPFAQFEHQAWSGGAGIIDVSSIVELAFYVRGYGEGQVLIDDVRVGYQGIPEPLPPKLNSVTSINRLTALSGIEWGDANALQLVFHSNTNASKMDVELVEKSGERWKAVMQMESNKTEYYIPFIDFRIADLKSANRVLRLREIDEIQVVVDGSVIDNAALKVHAVRLLD